MAELGDDSVQLFAQPRKSSKRKHINTDEATPAPKSKYSKKDLDSSSSLQQQQQEQNQDMQEQGAAASQPSTSEMTDSTFHDLGVSDWLCTVLNTLGEHAWAFLSAGLSVGLWSVFCVLCTVDLAVASVDQPSVCRCLMEQVSKGPHRCKWAASQPSCRAEMLSVQHRLAVERQLPLHCLSCSIWRRTLLGCFAWCSHLQGQYCRRERGG